MSEYGNYIVINGKRMNVRKHDTDFSVIGRTRAVDSEKCSQSVSMSPTMIRVSAASADDRNDLMGEARKDSVAHHIYQLEDTGEEIVIDDLIFLELNYEDTGDLQKIMQEYSLKYEGKMGKAHVLKVTSETGENPLKTANKIAEKEGISVCMPQIVPKLELHQVLFHQQWYLAADNWTHPDLLPDADIDAVPAWQITRGNPEIVIAVIDDGFDLDHPVFRNVRIHSDAHAYDPYPGEGDYHGTPVASIAVGSHDGGAMKGIAPNCTFLPVRISIGHISHWDMLQVFRFVSERADVVNCSFGYSPSTYDPIPENFRDELSQMTRTGGRRRKGLVIVFSAGNSDAPTYLRGSDNRNGVKFAQSTITGGWILSEIPAGQSVFSGYPTIPGVIVVGSMSSMKRKSGYSNWGSHITVSAPSNNWHTILNTPQGTPGRNQFVANYRGVAQVAAANRPGIGKSYSPIPDNPYTPYVNENFYTSSFGGTSGAAPVVSGVAGLMLSVNSNLTADDVRRFIMSEADKDLEITPDLPNDPNLQGVRGQFIEGRSLFFGAGKINAYKAVKRVASQIPETNVVVEYSSRERQIIIHNGQIIDIRIDPVTRNRTTQTKSISSSEVQTLLGVFDANNWEGLDFQYSPQVANNYYVAIRLERFQTEKTVMVFGGHERKPQAFINIENAILSLVPAPITSAWERCYAGIDLNGFSIPRQGLYNSTLYKEIKTIDVEPYGSIFTYKGKPFIKGKISWFGGPNDSSAGGNTGLTGEDPMTLSPNDFYCAMRWAYQGQKGFWVNRHILIVNPRNNKAVIARAIDWGPHTRTGRILDLSKSVLDYLSVVTDDELLCAFSTTGPGRLGIGPV